MRGTGAGNGCRPVWAAAPWLPAAQTGRGQVGRRRSPSLHGRRRGLVPGPKACRSPPSGSPSSSTAHRGRRQTSLGAPAALWPGCSACLLWGPCLWVKAPLVQRARGEGGHTHSSAAHLLRRRRSREMQRGEGWVFGALWGCLATVSACTAERPGLGGARLCARSCSSRGRFRGCRPVFGASLGLRSI